ncbi:hypothetical protein BJL93_01915 [Bifidobacterium bifidum]|nr:hypothetical protein BJL93_01915 [Bifidobacterium bifidum]
MFHLHKVCINLKLTGSICSFNRNFLYSIVTLQIIIICFNEIIGKLFCSLRSFKPNFNFIIYIITIRKLHKVIFYIFFADS